MALNNYTYSIYDDFIINHKVDITILQDEITGSNISAALHHIDANIEDDDCIVWFESALTQDENYTLDDIISAHTGELASGGDSGDSGSGGSGDIIIPFGDHSGSSYYRKINSNSYKTLAHIIFNGTKSLGIPSGIKACIKGYGGLRLCNAHTCEVYFDWYVTNKISNYTIYSQQTNINLPETECLLELQGIKGAKDLYISSFMIAFSGNVIDNIPE